MIIGTSQCPLSNWKTTTTKLMGKVVLCITENQLVGIYRVGYWTLSAGLKGNNLQVNVTRIQY